MQARVVEELVHRADVECSQDAGTLAWCAEPRELGALHHRFEAEGRRASPRLPRSEWAGRRRTVGDRRAASLRSWQGDPPARAPSGSAGRPATASSAVSRTPSSSAPDSLCTTRERMKGIPLAASEAVNRRWSSTCRRTPRGLGVEHLVDRVRDGCPSHRVPLPLTPSERTHVRRRRGDRPAHRPADRPSDCSDASP